MDNTQFNQLNMFRAVAKHAANNQAITDTIVAFKNGIIALNTKITAIQTTSGEQDLAISGVTENKNQLKEALVQSTFSHISPTKAYALSINNTTLKAQMNLSETDIRRLNDDQIGQNAQTLLGIVNNLVGVLGDYGITNATINSWQQDINNYLNTALDPRIAIMHRASLTEELVTLFKEANTILKETLDPISVSFQANNKPYLSAYKKARNIIDLGKGSTRIKGKITMLTADGEAAFNIKVKINEQNIESISDVEGLFVLEPDAPSTIALTVSGDGVETQTTKAFAIKKGDTLIKNFILQPTANP